MEWTRLGRAIAQARQRRSWTQRQLAARAGVSAQTIWRLETAAQASYDPATVVGVERALGWASGSVEAVLRGGTPTDEPDEELAALLTVWRSLSARDRAAVLQLARSLAR